MTEKLTNHQHSIIGAAILAGAVTKSNLPQSLIICPQYLPPKIHSSLNKIIPLDYLLPLDTSFNPWFVKRQTKYYTSLREDTIHLLDLVTFGYWLVFKSKPLKDKGRILTTDYFFLRELKMLKEHLFKTYGINITIHASKKAKSSFVTLNKSNYTKLIVSLEEAGEGDLLNLLTV